MLSAYTSQLSTPVAMSTFHKSTDLSDASTAQSRILSITSPVGPSHVEIRRPGLGPSYLAATQDSGHHSRSPLLRETDDNNNATSHLQRPGGQLPLLTQSVSSAQSQGTSAKSLADTNLILSGQHPLRNGKSSRRRWHGKTIAVIFGFQLTGS